MGSHRGHCGVGGTHGCRKLVVCVVGIAQQVPLVVITLLVLGISRNKARILSCGSGIVVAAVSFLVLSRANVWLRDELYAGSSGKESRMVEKFLDPANTSSIVRGFIGQTWYLMATTLGLIAVGLVALGANALTGAKNRRTDQWVAPLFTIGAVFLVVLTSALQLVIVIRPDHLVYGRYAEVVSPILLVVGLSAMITLRRRATLTWTFGIGAIGALIAAMAVAAGRDELRSMISRGKFFAAPNATRRSNPGQLCHQRLVDSRWYRHRRCGRADLLRLPLSASPHSDPSNQSFRHRPRWPRLPHHRTESTSRPSSMGQHRRRWPPRSPAVEAQGSRFVLI